MDKKFIFNTKGLINHNNNCYMDSVLMSMFCYKDSPFFKFFDPKWMDNLKNNKIKDEINNDSITDDELNARKKIQEILCQTINFSLENKNVNCGELRNYIEMFFW